MTELLDTMAAQGWALIDLPAPDAARAVADRLERLLGTPLASYFETDDDLHQATQARLSGALAADGLLPDLVRRQRALLDAVAGPDYLVQAHPYLRIARPGLPQDNIGYHRDTDYGSDPCELSVWVPFVDLPAEGSLEVADGSHRREIGVLARMPAGATGSTRGSPRHALGFPYAPKILEPSALQDLHGVPIRVGQALIVRLSTVHGTTCNRATVARWSADVRIAPAAFAASARPDYYLLPAVAV